MQRRVLFSSLFFIGLIVGVAALIGLTALDSYFSRFGDGAGSTSNTAGFINHAFAALICAYFVLSGIGVLSAKTKRALAIFAGIVHILPLAALGLIIFHARGGSSFVVGAIVILVAALIFFLPWLILWGVIFRRWRT